MKKIILLIMILVCLFPEVQAKKFWGSFNPGKNSHVTRHPVKRNGKGVFKAPKFRPCIVKHK